MVFDHIELDSLSRHDKIEAPALIIEGIEDQRDPVISTYCISIPQVGPDSRGIRVVTAKSGVEIVFIVGEENFSAHGRGDILSGPDLVFELQDKRLFPRFLAQNRVNIDFRISLGHYIRVLSRS